MKCFHPSLHLQRFLLTFIFTTGLSALIGSSYEISHHALKKKHVLVVGGSGRVGGSVVTQLVQQESVVTVGGTNVDNFEASRERWLRLFPAFRNSLSKVEFECLERESDVSVIEALQKSRNGSFDLVIHCAGPFQGKAKTPNGVLKACVDLKIPYIDVCDDYCTACAAKTAHAAKATVPCILSTGCWPGVSSLMAKQLVQKSLAAFPNLAPADLSVDFGFFTAGSGGAGVTLLVATFLILAEKALVIQNGRRKTIEALRDFSRLSFGEILGERDIAPLNLLETASIHDVLGVGSTISRFGTAPGFWNTLLGLMARLPSSLLENEVLMRKLAVFSMPIVRVVDAFAGAANSMRCDVTSSKEPSLRATAIYAHDNLEPCVGECVVAFACAVLAGAVPPGVWFPEEAIQAGEDAAAVLSLASVGAHTTQVHATGFPLLPEEVWGSKTTQLSVRN